MLWKAVNDCKAHPDFALRHLLPILLILAGFVHPCPLTAQGEHSPAASSAEFAAARSVAGIVLDPSGAAIPGARVVLRTSERGAALETKRDATGTFHFDTVRTGKYDLEVEAEGFRSAQIQATVTARRTPAFRVVLQILVQTENVTVGTGENVPLINTDIPGNQNTNAVDRNALDRIPVFDQDYITAMSRFLDDNATGTNGVTLVVNGIEANGPGVTPSAVQEVRINNNPYSARFSRPGRARLEIITKGGSSEYHGSLNFLFRDSVFDASNAFALVKPPERRQYYEGSVTGPLGHSKRTSFLLALDDDLL